MGINSGETEKDLEIELIESLIDNGLYDEALSFLDRLFKKYQDEYFIYLKGRVFYLTGKFRQAIEELTTVITQDSDFWEAYQLLGEIYRSTNQPELAESYYFKATSLNPRAYQSWLGRGKLAIQRGEHQIAVLSFETYLRIQKEDSEVWRLLGKAYKDMENYTSAIDAYNEAIELSPTDQEIYEEMGDLYLVMGRADLAKERYLQGLQVEVTTRPVNKDLYIKLSKLYIEERQHQRAFNICNELLALQKDEPDALFVSGIALVRMGQKYEGTRRIKNAYEIIQKKEYKEFLDKLEAEIYGPKYA